MDAREDGGCVSDWAQRSDSYSHMHHSSPAGRFTSTPSADITLHQSSHNRLIFPSLRTDHSERTTCAPRLRSRLSSLGASRKAAPASTLRGVHFLLRALRRVFLSKRVVELRTLPPRVVPFRLGCGLLVSHRRLRDLGSLCSGDPLFPLIQLLGPMTRLNPKALWSLAGCR